MPNRTPKQQPASHAAKDAKDVERMRLEHDLITDSGIVPATKGRHAIYCLTVIGTIEGHSLAPDNQKSTKYEHVIPQLVDIEEDPAIEGLLVILNTVGGDVEAGLALAELDLRRQQAQRNAGAGRRAFHRHPAGGFGPQKLYCAHRHHDGASGAPLRHGAGGAPDPALF